MRTYPTPPRPSNSPRRALLAVKPQSWYDEQFIEVVAPLGDVLAVACGTLAAFE